MTKVLTKSGKEVRYYVETSTGASGYVYPTGDAAAGRYETWDHKGLACYVAEDDLSWAPTRPKVVTFDDIGAFRYIRCAQNHSSAILFHDGEGITICRGTQLLRLAYNEITKNYQVSRNGTIWESFV